MSKCVTPVLIITFQRSALLRRLIDALRPVSPQNLFISCDGPRQSCIDDLPRIAAVHAIIENDIDWPCNLHCHFSETNLGCSLGPITAINWFFNQVEHGIILEEDCIPNPDFLLYCTELIERHKHDQRIWCISGNSYLPSPPVAPASYFFSRYTLTWGWATWRDRWQQFDLLLLRWPALRDSGLFQQLFEDRYEADYWAEIFERTYRREEPITWWDYQWFFAALSRGALTAMPVRNLVSNIGFGEGATHTLNPDTPIHPALPLGPITHPDFVVRHRDADTYTYAHHYGGIRRRRLRTLQARIVRRWSMLLGWLGLQ